ncbi:hypothetical protein HPB49_020496 [Dermacentor silvarum]|uniref:Uncharacterized protein n=1 Tax=Dermacentor silvarum TaxID=543639 RepID=A0ACB8CH88_DERSI|nr:hypothetical protein HPB49_020496 [Dermacentor silvarum]
MTLDGERHDVTAYVAAEAQHARCVVHGLPKDIPDDQLLHIISIEDRHILAARRLGQSETILLTVKGATVPKEVKMGLWLTKTQPFRPRAVQCTICFTIGHRANVCPTAHEFTRCETCGQQFPPAHRPDQTAHECEVRCFNCEGPHGARDPRCSKKQQADKLTRLAAERRRLKTTSKDSGQPKNRQTSQSIATNPPKKNDQNYPSLPLHNRFEALRDTTPDPKSEPRPRSGSLPGYPTKRSTPPPPPPKPKTPSFVRALLSQKPPAHSEEPPQKQPRHSSPEKLEKSDLLWTGDFNSRHAYWGYPDSSEAAAADISEGLRASKYWASYNVAYFDDIFNISGQPAKVQKYGDYYSYEHCPRAKMLKRDHDKLTDMDSIMTYMRYNDYKNDPLSRCNCTPPYNPAYAIAARYDLLCPHGKYGLPGMYRRGMGGIDVKVTNRELSSSLDLVKAPKLGNCSIADGCDSRLLILSDLTTAFRSNDGESKLENLKKNLDKRVDDEVECETPLSMFTLCQKQGTVQCIT